MRRSALLASVGLLLATLVGCQTWIPELGLTLPTGDYLKHPPGYYPPSPTFPLSRELASQEAAAAVLLAEPGAARGNRPQPQP